jgi:hypothetical protein
MQKYIPLISRPRITLKSSIHAGFEDYSEATI